MDGREEKRRDALLAGSQRELVSAHLLLITRLLRRSAKTDFAGFEPHNQLQRRIVLSLYRIGSARVSGLSAILGNDISQISRALNALRDDGTVVRGRQRDPYGLSARGQQLGAKMDHVADRRESELVEGFSAKAMFELGGMMSRLQQRAGIILAEEIAALRDTAPEPAPSAELMELASRVHPAVVNLSTAVQRAATLAFKRLTGLPNYEWRLLANVAFRPDISFTELVVHIGSDKGQVSRALDSLVSRGMVERRSEGRGQAVSLALTELGEATHAIMLEDALRRNAQLVGDLRPQQRTRLGSYLQRLVDNALAMAERDA